MKQTFGRMSTSNKYSVSNKSSINRYQPMIFASVEHRRNALDALKILLSEHTPII